MRRLLSLIILVFCCSTALADTPPQWPGTDAAVQAAERFVERLDNGSYQQLWQEATPLFQALNPAEKWTARQQLIRTAYGPRLSRQFHRLDQRNNFALSPDGHYCIVQFESSFQNKQYTIETIVLIETLEGAWLVREYVIR